MAKVTVIGAGVMGSALTIPLSDNGHRVALCGTEFDRAIIESCLAGRSHPGLGARLPGSVQPFHIGDLERALMDADIVVIGVISRAVGKITRKIAPFLSPGITIVNAAKGLEESASGHLRTLPEIIATSLPQGRREHIAVVAIGGPSKALELASRHVTCVVFASEQSGRLDQCIEIFATNYYHIWPTTDVLGVEVCAAIKNGFAIGVGISDGLAERISPSSPATTMDNLRSAVFNQAVYEMKALTQAFGGRPETVYGLAGLGDLYVTCRQGRNVTLGRLLGQGHSCAEAMELMKGATVEGIEAIRAVRKAIKALEMKGEAKCDDFPLLNHLYSVLFEEAPVCLEIDKFFDSQRKQAMGKVTL
ncbi:MAG: NAD(P)H-dependent glycerol-3-phosphate dehydrogenase [Anaerolineae bacterium]